MSWVPRVSAATSTGVSSASFAPPAAASGRSLVESSTTPARAAAPSSPGVNGPSPRATASPAAAAPAPALLRPVLLAHLGRRRLGPETFNLIRAARQVRVWIRAKVTAELIRVKVTAGQIRPYSEPPGPHCRVFAEDVQTSPAQTEVLRDVEDLDGFVGAAPRHLLVDDEIYVHVGVDKVPVCASPHGALDTHQAVFLQLPQNNGGAFHIYNAVAVLGEGREECLCCFFFFFFFDSFGLPE